MKVKIAKWALSAFFFLSLVVLAISFVTQRSRTFSSYLSESHALQGISGALRKEGTSQWQLRGVGVGYGNDINAPTSQEACYYPIRRLFLYGSKKEGWTQIYGVTIEDIHRIAQRDGDFKELDLPR